LGVLSRQVIQGAAAGWLDAALSAAAILMLQDWSGIEGPLA
jgi:hypothetical protein